MGQRESRAYLNCVIIILCTRKSISGPIDCQSISGPCRHPRKIKNIKTEIIKNIGNFKEKQKFKQSLAVGKEVQ